MLAAALSGAARSVRAALRAWAGGGHGRGAVDRLLLEQVILPACAARPDVRRVVFVGCARYTQSYSGLFGNAEYWTIDPAPRSARWGATRHVVDRLQCLDRHFAPDSLDLVVCNGVLGWGLDRRADAEAAFDACRRVLRPGGRLVLGWNDVWPRNRVQPRSLGSLARFDAAELPGLGAEAVRLDVPHRHVFECYRKPGAEAGQGSSVVTASGAGTQSPSARQRPSMHSS